MDEPVTTVVVEIDLEPIQSAMSEIQQQMVNQSEQAQSQREYDISISESVYSETVERFEYYQNQSMDATYIMLFMLIAVGCIFGFMMIGRRNK